MIITLPYRERAAMAVLSAAQNTGMLQGVIDSVSVKNWVGRNTASPGFVGSSSVTVQSVGLQADVLRSLANQFKIPSLSLSAMHLSKVLFDQSAAKSTPSTVEFLLGFPGASRRIFSTVPSEATKILHCVDAHPRSHNSALLAHFSKETCKAELYPNWLVERIEAEIEAADILLVPSSLVADQMQAHGTPHHKIMLEPYGVDFGLFRPALAPGEPSSEPDKRVRPKVIYVGQISRRKGISYLMEAVKNVAIDVELIGNVFDPSVLKYAPANVSISQPLGHQDLVIKYQDADAFVIPTIEDACSLVALEAAASGLPVISTPVNGAMEILPKRISSTFVSGNVPALRELLVGVKPLTKQDRHANVQSVRAGLLRDWNEYGKAVVGGTKRSDS